MAMSGDSGVIVARQTVDFGDAVIRDMDGGSAHLLTVNGVPQSYVDIKDPSRLGFDYMYWLSVSIDAVAPAGEPIRVLHLGGGGLTLARYVAATRPASRQVVVEADGRLAEFVSRRLPLSDDANVELRVTDAYEAVTSLPDADFDLVINDVYRVTHLPSHLAGPTFPAAIARVLAPAGLYTLNVLDMEQLRATRAQLAALGSRFTDTCLVAAHTELGSKDFLNAVLAATNDTRGIPLTALKDAAMRRGIPTALLHGPVVAAFTAGME